LAWASQKSRTISTTPKIATTRAFYLALAQTPHLAFQFALASALDQGILLDAALDDLRLNCIIDRSQDFAHARACSNVLDNILVIVQDVGFHKALQQLSNELPNPDQNEERFQNWWQTHYATWFERLNKTIINYRNINHPWQFSPEQEQVLQRYYDANQLLMDCLNSNCAVTAATRQEIEAALLLPQKELEDREWQ
jgi:predicted NACHT family NTPase